MNDSLNLPPLAAGWPQMLPGWVWLAGAGPGDPGLLSLHALNALKQAEVIICDALVNQAILDWANPEAEIVFAGKRGGVASPLQKDISLHLIDLARSGKRVLRLKGGDPFVFGRGGEEAQTLAQHGVNFRIIPGVSAGIGGLSYAGIPVTHRDLGAAVTFITGHDPKTVNWPAIAEGSPTIVIYMGMKNVQAITGALMDSGRNENEPVAVVANASLPDQKVLETTLSRATQDIADSGLKAPAIICVGQAVLLRQVLDWQGLVNGAPLRDTDPLGLGHPVEGQ